MSIEQTNQLILLILNSVLMTLLSSILLGGAWLRQNALLQQLHKARWQGPSEGRSHYHKLTHSALHTARPESFRKIPDVAQTIAQSTPRPAEIKPVRDRRQQLSQQYRWSRIGMLILHTTLLTFSISLFTLALRSLLDFDSLISAALFLFTIGAAGLLIGTGCLLIDLAKGNSSDDSLGHTLAKVLQRLNGQWINGQWKNQWQRSSLKRGLSPTADTTHSAEQGHPVTFKPTNLRKKQPPSQ